MKDRNPLLAAAPLALAACVAMIGLIGLAPTASAASRGRAASATTIEGQYIVVLQDNQADPAGFARRAGHSPMHVYRHALKGFAARMSDRAAAALRRNPAVRFVQADSVVKASVQTLPDGINRIDAETNATAQIDGVDVRVNVDVAIIDTGIDPSHADLNVVGGVNFTKGKSHQWQDQHGHGTHVAGTVAALDNDLGVVGVAPGARLWAVRVLGRNGSGSTSGVVAGIDWVTARADVIKVANMSLGGAGSSDGNCGNTNGDAEHVAICAAVAAGITFVVAAGNESTNANESTPAAYEEVLTVSALADFDGEPGGLGSGNYAFSSCTEAVDDSFACFSNYGAAVDIMAPGVGIYSTAMGGGYTTMSGTSMACPHVAGAAALIMADHPTWTPADVRAELLATAKPTDFVTDDPDGIHEPLLNVGAAPVGHDLAATAVSAQASAAPGELVVVTVDIANQGTFDDTAVVTLTDLTDGVVIGTASAAITAGGSLAFPFVWDTASASINNHTLAAEVAAVAGETDLSDNSASTAIVLQVAVHDVAVNSVAVADPVVAGSTASVSVAVANIGTYNETVAVTLSDANGVVATQSPTIAAGGSAVVTFNWNTAGLALGSQALTATAAVAIDANTLNNSATATTTLIEVSALVVTVSTDKASYKSGQYATITAHVTDGSAPVASASVAITIATPNGKLYSGSALSGASGDAVFSFRTNGKKDGYGTYTATADASKSGYDAGSVSATFAVTK